MVHISRETTAATEQRLLRVTQQARLVVYPGTFAFLEFALEAFPEAVRPDALALVATTRSGVNSSPAPTQPRSCSGYSVSNSRQVWTTAAS